MIRYVFNGTETTSTENVEMECYVNSVGEISIMLKDVEFHNRILISLEKDTAIKFHRALKREISLLNSIQNEQIKKS